MTPVKQSFPGAEVGLAELDSIIEDIHADLVLHLSLSSFEVGEQADASSYSHDSELIEELRHRLRPGTEIVLLFDRYVARTSLLWLSGMESGSDIKGGVRLLDVSARPERDHQEIPTDR